MGAREFKACLSPFLTKETSVHVFGMQIYWKWKSDNRDVAKNGFGWGNVHENIMTKAMSTVKFSSVAGN